MKFKSSTMTQFETSLDIVQQSSVNPNDDASHEDDPALAETLVFDNLPFLSSSLDLTTEPRNAYVGSLTTRDQAEDELRCARSLLVAISTEQSSGTSAGKRKIAPSSR